VRSLADGLLLSVLAMLGFGALAPAGLIMDPDLGRYLAAAGFFLHGGWDFVYCKLDRVVARSQAEPSNKRTRAVRKSR
jgi:hypothetical protein